MAPTVSRAAVRTARSALPAHLRKPYASGMSDFTLFSGTLHPLVSLAIYGLSAALIVVDFNYLRNLRITARHLLLEVR
jgi:hypothetical protein